MVPLQRALLAFKQGQFERGIAELRQLLHSEPRNIKAWQVLVNALLKAKKWDESCDAFDALIRLLPSDKALLSNAAACAINAGKFERAVKYANALLPLASKAEQTKGKVLLVRALTGLGEWTQILELFPLIDNVPNEILALYAGAHKALGKYTDAIAIYSQCLELQIEQTSSRHSRGLCFRQNGDPKSALDDYHWLLNNGVVHYALMHNTANAYSDLGMLTEAIDYYRKAIELRPSYVESHKNLNDLLFEQGELSQLHKSYQTVLAVSPLLDELRFCYIADLLRLKDTDTVERELSLLSDNGKEAADYAISCSRLARLQNNNEKAAMICISALSTTKFSIDQKNTVIETLLSAGEYERAYDLANEILIEQPSEQWTLANLGIAQRALQREIDSPLVDVKQWVREYALPVPDGFNCIEAFCSELGDYLATLHTGKLQPLEQTLQGGTQTRGNLFNDPHPLIKMLVSGFEECIAQYRRDTASFAEPYAGFKHNEDIEFSGSWSVMLRSQGFHSCHIHPMGWLSSAFYVTLPKSCVNSQEGWLKIGEPNFTLPTSMAAMFSVKPEIGKLVLFPSYVWHGTVPFNSDDIRMTVAYDVIKAR